MFIIECHFSLLINKTNKAKETARIKIFFHKHFTLIIQILAIHLILLLCHVNVVGNAYFEYP